MKTAEQIRERIETLERKAWNTTMENLANDYEIMAEALEWVLSDD